MADNKYIVNNNSVYELQENELLSYYAKLEVEEVEPRMTWHGGKFDLEMWDDIKNICQYTQDEHNSECMVRLYYNQKDKIWKACFFPQKMSGMTVSDEFDASILKESGCSMEDGFVEAGSLHHHCSSSAFQSKTDEKDEEGTPGIHITLGHIEKVNYELHARYKTPEDGFVTPKILSLFPEPEWWKHVPTQLLSQIKFETMSKLILSKGDAKKAKKEWVDRIIPKTKVVSGNYYGGHNGMRGGQTSLLCDHDLLTEDEWLKKTMSTTNGSKNTTAKHTTKLTDKELDELIDEKEGLYQDILIDMMVPNVFELEQTGYSLKLNCDDIKALIVGKKTLENQDNWHYLREQIQDYNKENKLVNLHDLHKYVKEHFMIIEEMCWGELETIYSDDDKETKSDDDEMGKTNHNVGTPIL